MKVQIRSVLLASATLSLLSLAGCDPSASSTESKSYSFEENGCATGQHNYSSNADYCAALLDEKLNNYCATDLRYETYATGCASTVSATPTPTSTPTNSNILSPQQPTSCLSSDAATPKGNLVAPAAFINGVKGAYRLLKIEGSSALKGDQPSSISVYGEVVQVDHDSNATVTGDTICHQSGSMTIAGSVELPVRIDRADGSLAGGMSLNFHTGEYSNPLQVRPDDSRLPKTFAELASLAQTGGATFNVYQMDAQKFQILLKIPGSNVTPEAIYSATYVFEPASAIPVSPAFPTPTPTPTATPAQSPASAPNGAAVAGKVCEEFDYTSQKVDCMLTIKKLRIDPSVVSICNEFDYTSQKVDCFKALDGGVFTKQQINVCGEFDYTSQKVDCLKKFAN